MAKCVTRTAWLASGGTSRYSSTFLRTLPSAHACLSVPSLTTIHIQKRSLLASLGGTTALFVGASVLTVVETALFVVRHGVDLIIGRRTGRMELLDYND